MTLDRLAGERIGRTHRRSSRASSLAQTRCPSVPPQHRGTTRNVDDTSGIPDWTAQVNDALTTTDRAAQALKWQTLNKEAVEQAWIIPLFFSLSQNMAGTEVGGAYRWTPYASWPYAQLYVEVARLETGSGTLRVGAFRTVLDEPDSGCSAGEPSAGMSLAAARRRSAAKSEDRAATFLPSWSVASAAL